MTPTPVLTPDSIDAMRSLRRAMSFVLPDDWDLAWTRTEDMARPCGTIMPIGPERNSGSAYVRDVERDFEMFLYPPGYEGGPELSRLEAERLATTVSLALSQGHAASGLRSLRVPLYDYSDVPMDAGQPVHVPGQSLLGPARTLSSQERLGDVQGAEPYGYLVLRRSFTVEPRVDPDDSDLFAVIVRISASWRTDGDRGRFDGAILQSVETGPSPPYQQDA